MFMSRNTRRLRVGLAILMAIMALGVVTSQLRRSGSRATNELDRGDELARGHGPLAGHDGGSMPAAGAALSRGHGGERPGSAQPATRPDPAAYRKGARTLVPRPTPPSPSEGESTDERPRARLSAVGTLRDRREDPSGDSEALVAAVHGGLELVREDIETCLAAWSAVDSSIQGQVMLAFRIDENGLQDVWIEDYADVPMGPLSCFGSAVYEVDWSGISESPIEITHGFGYGPDQNGVGDADAGSTGTSGS